MKLEDLTIGRRKFIKAATAFSAAGALKLLGCTNDSGNDFLNPNSTPRPTQRPGATSTPRPRATSTPRPSAIEHTIHLAAVEGGYVSSAKPNLISAVSDPDFLRLSTSDPEYGRCLVYLKFSIPSYFKNYEVKEAFLSLRNVHDSEHNNSPARISLRWNLDAEGFEGFKWSEDSLSYRNRPFGADLGVSSQPGGQLPGKSFVISEDKASGETRIDLKNVYMIGVEDGLRGGNYKIVHQWIDDFSRGKFYPQLIIEAEEDSDFSYDVKKYSSPKVRNLYPSVNLVIEELV